LSGDRVRRWITEDLSRLAKPLDAWPDFDTPEPVPENKRYFAHV